MILWFLGDHSDAEKFCRDRCFSQAARGDAPGVFLVEMARVVPWRRLEALIEPHYGRKPYPLGVMLRVHFPQHWYGYSDPGMEDALHDMPALRRFAGLDAGESRMPDETTILNFRHLLEAHQMAERLTRNGSGTVLPGF